AGSVASTNTGSVSRGPLRRGDARQRGRAASSVGDASVPPTTMGRVLAGGAVVGRPAPRPLLVRAFADKPQRHTLGSGVAGAGIVSADRDGQRVDAAPRYVRTQ